ncbi:hypothetical protein ACKLNO_01385 [Neisseriaceae bacterium B1]
MVNEYSNLRRCQLPYILGVYGGRRRLTFLSKSLILIKGYAVAVYLSVFIRYIFQAAYFRQPEFYSTY